jgi:hypothetical protein
VQTCSSFLVTTQMLCFARSAAWSPSFDLCDMID